MKLAELSYKPKLGGQAHGAMMLHIVEEGPDGPSVSWQLMDVVNRCEQASQMMNTRIKVVLVQPHPETNTEEMTKFLMMLKDRGFTVGLILEGVSIPIYMREASFIQAILHGPKWENYRVTEILYQPTDDLTEPEIQQNNIYCGKYLFMPKKAKPMDYLTFIRTAQFPWNLIVPPSREVSVDFLKEK